MSANTTSSAAVSPEHVVEKEPDIQDAPFDGTEIPPVSQHYWKGLIAEETRALGLKIADVEEKFSSIEAAIRKMEELGAFEAYNQDEKCTPFLRRWQELHDKYTIIAADSRNSALTLDSKIDDFVENIIPVLQSTQYDIAQKKHALADYLTYMKDFKPQGNDKGLLFLRLRQEIEQFKKDITTATPAASPSRASWGDAFKNTMSQITDVEAQVDWVPHKTISKLLDGFGAAADRVQEVISAAGRRKGTTASIAGQSPRYAVPAIAAEDTASAAILGVSGICSAGAFQTLCAIAPYAAGALILGLVGYSVYTAWKEIQDEDESIKAAIAELEKAKAKLDFSSLGQRLQMIHTAWQEIVDDAQKLMEKFEAFDRSTDPLMLERRIDQFKTVYEALQVAMKAYIAMFSATATA